MGRGMRGKRVREEEGKAEGEVNGLADNGMGT